MHALQATAQHRRSESDPGPQPRSAGCRALALGIKRLHALVLRGDQLQRMVLGRSTESASIAQTFADELQGDPIVEKRRAETAEMLYNHKKR